MRHFLTGFTIGLVVILITLLLAPFGTYVSLNRNTGSEAVWLEKLNMFRDWEKTSLFFGYYDNLAACVDFKDTYTKKYYADKYRCREVKWHDQ